MEIEENIGIGELIPENEVDGNNLIDYEAEINELPTINNDKDLCFIFLFDQSLYITIDKNEIKSTDSIQMLVLCAFRTKYPKTFSELKGTKVNAFYKKNKDVNNNDRCKYKGYSEIKDDYIELIFDAKEYIFVDILSTEVWVEVLLNINCGFLQARSQSKMKIDRFIKQNNLHRVMLKTCIIIWNHILSNAEKDENEKGKNKINVYLHFHYLISAFTFLIKNSKKNRLFNWDKEFLSSFNIEFDISLNLSIFEEKMFAILQNQISKITIEKLNMLWNGFSTLKNFDAFVFDDKLENEFNTMKANVKSTIFNMGKEDSLYLYFSKTKLEDNSNELSSSSIIGFEKEKEEINLIICPKVIDKKRKSKKKLKPINKYIDGEDGIVISMPEIKKTAMDKVKVFVESPMEEPLLNSREIKININGGNGTNISNNNHPSSGSKKSDLSGDASTSHYYAQKKSFEDVNTVAKKIYKTYEKNDEDVDSYQDDLSSKNKKKHGCCSKFLKMISETRNPSINLSLARQIKKMVNISVINKILNVNDIVKGVKNEFDRYVLPIIKDFEYEWKYIEISEEIIDDNLINSSIKKFNLEMGVVTIGFVILMVILFFVIRLIYIRSNQIGNIDRL